MDFIMNNTIFGYQLVFVFRRNPTLNYNTTAMSG